MASPRKRKLVWSCSLLMMLAASALPASASFKNDILEVDAAAKLCREGPEGQTPSGLSGCLHSAYVGADLILNRLVETIKNDPALDPRTVALMRAAQDSWIAFRESELRLKPQDEFSSAADAQAVDAAIFEMTKTRILELNARFHESPDDEP